MEQNDFYMARIEGQQSGVPWNNRIWYKLASFSAVDTFAEALVDHLINNIYTPYLAYASTAATISKVEAFLWKEPIDDYHIDITGLAGLDGAQAVPTQNCVTFRNVAPFPGARYSYIRMAGLTETNVNGNQLVEVVNWNNVANALGDTVALAGGVLVPVQVKSSTIPDMGTGLNPVQNRWLNQVWQYRLGTQDTRMRRGAAYP